VEKEVQHIIDGCCQNDRWSQEKLYRMFFPTMMGMCMRHTKDEGEAMMILNNGFLKVFKNISSFKGTGSFEGWIRRIVYHSISDYFRSQSKYLKFLMFEEYDQKVNTVEHKLFEEDILKLIGQLPDSSAEVFIKYCIEGYTHVEIAKLRNISVGTSKWHLSNARKKLQEMLLRQSNLRNIANG